MYCIVLGAVSHSALDSEILRLLLYRNVSYITDSGVFEGVLTTGSQLLHFFTPRKI